MNALRHAVYLQGHFSGFWRKAKKERHRAAQANALADKLTKAGENFVAGLFFTAGYDPPFRLTGASCELPLRKPSHFYFGTLRCTCGRTMWPAIMLAMHLHVEWRVLNVRLLPAQECAHGHASETRPAAKLYNQ